MGQPNTPPTPDPPKLPRWVGLFTGLAGFGLAGIAQLLIPERHQPWAYGAALIVGTAAFVAVKWANDRARFARWGYIALTLTLTFTAGTLLGAAFWLALSPGPFLLRLYSIPFAVVLVSVAGGTIGEALLAKDSRLYPIAAWLEAGPVLGTASIAVGVANIALGVALIAGGDTAVGVASIALGVAGIAVGVAIIAEHDIAYGAAIIAGGAAIIAGGVARIAGGDTAGGAVGIAGGVGVIAFGVAFLAGGDTAVGAGSIAAGAAMIVVGAVGIAGGDIAFSAVGIAGGVGVIAFGVALIAGGDTADE